MKVCERSFVSLNDQRFIEADDLTFRSKNLYNAANYLIRQVFFSGELLPSWNKLCYDLREHEAYCALPRKVSQHTVKAIREAWDSYFKALKAYSERPQDFQKKPNINDCCWSQQVMETGSQTWQANESELLFHSVLSIDSDA